MVKSAGEMQKKMQKLKQAYLEHLPEKIQEVHRHLEKLLAGEGNNESYLNLRRLVHSIKGSSASFGYPDIKDMAIEVEESIQSLEPHMFSDDEWSSRLREQLSRLENAVALHKNTIPEEEDVHFYIPPGDGFTASEETLVYIAEDDEYILQKVATQLSQFGYRVKAFSDIHELPGAVERQVPAAVIADIIFPESHSAGIEVMKKIQYGRTEPLPVIFISGRSDIQARLNSVRAGAGAYFVKPINIPELIENLDNLTRHKEMEPYRVLIVDDDYELASYHALILQNAGMKTDTVTNPLTIMEALFELNPDLILMDMYMPECNGLDLAKVIRQTKAYFSIPIVFLSAETDLDTQISVVNTAADEFLTKPIKPDHLISSVMARAERLRIIRSFMERDSLTGLLNHTKTKEHLDVALSRARRLKNDMAFAMIDIDKFKSINDTYGHPTGDRVIMVMARLLQQRLRKNDVIGRYGGEEFAVMLNDITLNSAEAVLNGLRVSFSNIKYQVEDKEFSVSFSCGYAMASDFGDPGEICNAADRALYLAKQEGRNRVMRAQAGKS